MASTLWGQISKLSSIGKLTVQHRNFVLKLLKTDAHAIDKALSNYFINMSEESFLGFKGIMLLHLKVRQGTKDVEKLNFVIQRSNELWSEMANRKSRTQSTQSASGESHDSEFQSMESVVNQEADRDLEFLNDLAHFSSESDFAPKLVDHIASMSVQRFNRFTAHLNETLVATKAAYNAHIANEKYAWGRFVEDQIAYLQASQRTGEKDPKFLKVSAEFERSISTIIEVIKVSPGIYERLNQVRSE